MNFLRQILILAVLTGLGWGGYSYYREHFAAGDVSPREARSQRGGRASSIEVAEAKLEEVTRSIEAVGTTRANRSVDIVPLADGRIVEMFATSGREVAEGDVIARLDDDIERANLASAEGTLLQKQQAVKRALQLRESQILSEATLETLRADEIVARSGVDKAKRQLADRTIRAPFSGVLGLTSIDIGARVESGDILATLDDLDEVEVEFQLPETLYARVHPGQRVTARTAAFPGREFEGSIVAIDSRVDRNSRSFTTRALLPNPDRALPSGMFVLMSIALDSYKAVVVPDAAIVAEGSQTFVFVIVDGKAMKTPVTVGLREQGRVEISRGVSDGDKIAVTGLQRLNDGASVEVLNEPQPAGDGKAIPTTQTTPAVQKGGQS